jgi:fatty-acyl-CoA synthase
MAVPSCTSPHATLAALLAHRAAVSGGHTAIVFEGQSLSYVQVRTLAAAIAHRLRATHGIRPGDRVAWLGANHPLEIVLLFALARLGAMFLPLNFRLAPAEWEAQVADCAPRLLVHDAAWSDVAQSLAARSGMPPVAADALATPPGDAASEAPATGQGDDPALLVFTSGTTGGPKAAVHTQANLLANMAIAAQVQGITPADTVLTVLPLFHVGGLCIQTLPALHAGARVLLHPRFSADDALAAIARERPTLTLQVPATMKALLEHAQWAETDVSSLRAVWAGSSLLPDALIAGFHARGLPLCNVYGATESGPFSIALGPEHARDRAGSCGWPAPGVEARLETSHGDANELLLRGPNVVQRYWPDRPAVDAEGWFHTGDLATRAADGSYTIVGRAKDLIITGGENVHPAEVETALAAHPAVAECAAFGLPDAQWGEVVAAAVVLKPGTHADEAVMRAHLEGRLARFKQPRRWLWLDALPKTALGKVQRGALQQRAMEMSSRA